MIVVRSIVLFVLAAVAEIGGAWLVWQGVREHRGWIWIGAGVIALGAYGFVATLQPDAHFGRILAAYGGVFVAGSLLWGVALDGFRPDRWDIIGALICLIGVVVIMPTWLQVVSHVNPLTYLVDALRGLLIGTPAHLLLDFAVLLGATAVGIWVSGALLGRLVR